MSVMWFAFGSVAAGLSWRILGPTVRLYWRRLGHRRIDPAMWANTKGMYPVCPCCYVFLVHHPDDPFGVTYHPDPRLSGTPCEWFTEQLGGQFHEERR